MLPLMQGILSHKPLGVKTSGEKACYNADTDTLTAGAVSSLGGGDL